MDDPTSPGKSSGPADSAPDAPETAPVSSLPQRDVRDPRELRALAHPLRLHLLEELATLGEATATELAVRVGQSPANCSWHLRQLARYGFIEEAGGGSGRSRPWRWVPRSTRISSTSDADPEARVARDAVLEVVVDRELASWRIWRDDRDEAPTAWRDASFEAVSMNWLTAEEFAALNHDLQELLERHLASLGDRVDPRRRPAGAQLVRMLALGFPSGPVAELPEPAAEAMPTGPTPPAEPA